MPQHQPAVVVIAPENIPVQVRKADVAVIRFSTSYEFEQWRKGPCARVAAAVHAVLLDLGVDLDACSPRTQDVIGRLTARETIPLVKEMVGLDSSRRSFYRSWMRDIGQSPTVFLERVRVLHVAQRGTPDALDLVR